MWAKIERIRFEMQMSLEKCTYSRGTASYEFHIPRQWNRWHDIETFFISKCFNEHFFISLTCLTSWDIAVWESFHVVFLLFSIQNSHNSTVYTLYIYLYSFRLSYFTKHSSLSHSTVPESLKHSRACENHEHKREIRFAMRSAKHKREIRVF